MRLACLASALLAALVACGEPGDDPRAAPPVEPYDPALLAGELPTVVDALAAGDPERALAELDRIAQQPGCPAGLDHFRGLALLDAGRPAEARAALAAEIAAHPGNAMAHLFLAESLLTVGEIAAAREHLQTAGHYVHLAYLDFLLGRAALLSEDDVGAATAFQRFLSEVATGVRAAEAHAGLAQIAQRQGQLDAARFHAQRSQHLEQAGQFLNAFRQQLSEHPDDPKAALGVGMVYLDLYREVSADPRLLTQAGDAFVATLQRDPENVKALYNLGFVLTVQGRGAEAQALHDRALALAPGHAGVLLNSGLLALELGDDERALDHLRRAAEAAADDGARASARLGLADALERAGRRDEALLELRAVLALDPDDPHDVTARIERLEAP